MQNETEKSGGWRERKRRETLERIAENGLRLFVDNGYDATTLESIAEAADISPRTFFYYFNTKEDILRFWQGGGMIEALGPSIEAEPTDQPPMLLVRNCLLRLIRAFETEKSVVVDRVLNSTDALRARKQAIFYQMEQIVFSALCTLWPRPEERQALRATALLSIGALRLAMETQRADETTRPLADYLDESLAMLRRQSEAIAAPAG